MKMLEKINPDVYTINSAGMDRLLYQEQSIVSQEWDLITIMNYVTNILKVKQGSK